MTSRHIPASGAAEPPASPAEDSAGQIEAPEDRLKDPFAGLPLLIPVPQAARLLGISRAAAYRFASTGELPTKRLGRRVYVVSAKNLGRSQPAQPSEM